MKTTLATFVFLCLGIIAHAQNQTTKGNFLLGNSLAIIGGSAGSSNLGSFSFSTNKYKDPSPLGVDEEEKINAFNFNPNIGYFVWDKLAVGLNAALFFQTQEIDVIGIGFKLKSSIISVGPFVRYYFLDNRILPFIEGGANYGRIKISNFTDPGSETLPLFSMNSAAGVSFLLGNSASFDAAFAYGFVKYEDTVIGSEVTNTSLGLQLGFKIFIGKMRKQE